jgi:hypothetical protein
MKKMLQMDLIKLMNLLYQQVKPCEGVSFDITEKKKRIREQV